MAVIPVQAVEITGTVANWFVASAGGDECEAGDRVFACVANASAGPVTLTVVVPGSEYGQQKPDIPIVVAPGTEAKFGPLSPEFADPTTGRVSWTYSAAAGVTVGALTI